MNPVQPKFPLFSLVLLCLLLACGTPCPALQAAEDLSAEATEQAAAWTVKYAGRPILVYAFRPGTFKPYVQQLCTINGDNVLRDAGRRAPRQRADPERGSGSEQ